MAFATAASGSTGSARPTTPDAARRAHPARAGIPLLIIDEVGYIPFEGEAANLFFQLVSSRYERASVIVTSNKAFSRWGEVFGDDVVAAAMIDRLVHHAEVVNLKGDSYRLKGRDIGRVPTTNDETVTRRGVNFRPSQGGQNSAVVDKHAPSSSRSSLRSIRNKLTGAHSRLSNRCMPRRSATIRHSPVVVCAYHVVSSSSRYFASIEGSRWSSQRRAWAHMCENGQYSASYTPEPLRLVKPRRNTSRKPISRMRVR